MKNLSKKLRISGIAVMAIGCLAAIIYAIYLLTWGFYLGAALVVVAGGIFVVGAFILFAIAKILDNTEEIKKNTSKEVKEAKGEF